MYYYWLYLKMSMTKSQFNEKDTSGSDGIFPLFQEKAKKARILIDNIGS